MTTCTVSRAWRPASGKKYGIVEVRMRPDFERADATLWGIVEARNLARRTSFDLLRVVGDPEWHERFDWLNYGPNARPWQQALGGANGGSTALAGIHAQGSRLTIKRLEVVGVPGAGILYQSCPQLRIGSASFVRCGWPIYGHHEAGSGGAEIHGVTSRDHWWSKAWGEQNSARGISTRRLESRGICARGELVLNEAGYELVDFVQSGDGIGWKCAGTQFTVRGYSGGPCFLAGTVDANLTTFPDTAAYRHLREARDIVVEDAYFASCSAALQARALLYVSGRFTTPAVIRRAVFRRTEQPFAVQLNTGAAAVFEDCDFVGFSDPQAALELDARPGYEASAKLVGCRGYDA